MGAPSPPDLLVLHAVRLCGFAVVAALAARFGLTAEVAEEHVLDDAARGWVRRTAFAGLTGWSLTDTGRVENERRLAAELDSTGARRAVEAAHEEFLTLNPRLLTAVTDWQLRPLPGDPLAANDHTDHRWDDRVLERLGGLAVAMAPVVVRLATALERFAGYDTRFAAALNRARQGRHAFVDGTGIDSCHVVWFQLHEDLIATLGLTR